MWKNAGADRRSQQLSAALRAATSRAAEAAGSSCALLFSSEKLPNGRRSTPHLRAAAGFASRDDAREAAGQVLSGIRGVIESGEPGTHFAEARARENSIREFRLLPLRFEDRTHGALAVGVPDDLPARASQRLTQLAASAGLRLDHGHLLEAADRRSPEADTGSGELLELSEALFAQDIELLRKNEKLGEIEQVKNDFIEKMSRELRTPLNNIIEAIISVIANENDRLSAQSTDCLRSALEQGSAFQRTLQNILDLWRIKQGELPVCAQEVNLAEVVDEAIFSVQETLAGKPIRIEKHLDEPMPKLCTDLTKINQIFFLLLDNAAKFTEQGRIVISARLSEDTLICSVEDTGIGICPDDRAAVFEEFYQVDDLASTRYSGAGLGLTLARDLLVLLGGEITLSSEVGKGSTFTFRVPVETC